MREAFGWGGSRNTRAMPLVPRVGTSANVTVDAVGEQVGVFGRVILESGPGTSKTISSAGGKIHFNSGGSNWVWADAATSIRFGIQDLDGTTSFYVGGKPDGTFDVYADMTTSSFTFGGINTMQAVPMTTGSKTITYGDRIAILAEMTARGGTDFTSWRSVSNTPDAFSNIVINTSYGIAGVNHAKSSSGLVTILEFDDGTKGVIEWYVPWINPISSSASQYPSTAYSSSSSPNEYGGRFQPRSTMLIDGFAFETISFSAVDDFGTLTFYENADGTPNAVEERAVSGIGSHNQGTLYIDFPAPRTLEAGKWYAITLRATGTGTMRVEYWTTTNSTYEFIKQFNPWFSDMDGISRTGGTGNFSVTEVFHMPEIVLSVLQPPVTPSRLRRF